MFDNHFEIKIDASKCTSLVEGGAFLDGKKAYDSWKGYNYAIDCALLISYMAGISETTYNLFLRTSGKTPSYSDFSNGACNCARNQDAIIRSVNIKHDDLIVAVSYYALTICACKGSLTDRDRNLINKFLTRK